MSGVIIRGGTVAAPSSSGFTAPPLAASWSTAGTGLTLTDSSSTVTARRVAGAAVSCAVMYLAFDPAKTYVACLDVPPQYTVPDNIGLGLRNDGGALRVAPLYPNAATGARLYHMAWSDTITRTAITDDGNYLPALWSRVWLRMRVTGGNYVWGFSGNGLDWSEPSPVIVTVASFTATGIGLVLESDASDSEVYRLLHWSSS